MDRHGVFAMTSNRDALCDAPHLKGQVGPCSFLDGFSPSPPLSSR